MNLRNTFRRTMENYWKIGQTLDWTVKSNKLLKFFVFEIFLFVADVGTDIHSAIKFGLAGNPHYAGFTIVCVLLPSIPKFFKFFGDKVKMYRSDAASQKFCIFKLSFWIFSFPIFLVGSSFYSIFQESIFTQQ